jgi:DHA2 family multidrug resistance protein-like MFS transporter
MAVAKITQRRWIVLCVVSIAMLLVAIDMTVLYIALPTITHALHADTTAKLWIINIYPLIVAGLLLGAGTLGDRIGHQRLFVSGLLIFGVASLLAAFSYSSYTLIFSRALLGVGAATMMPATLSIITLTFDDEKERSFAIGIWAAVASGGAAAGPLIGGWLLETFWWGAVFLINVPIVLIALVLGAKLIRNVRSESPRSWDFLASLQMTIGLIAFAYAIKAWAKPQVAWLDALSALAVSTLFLTLFVRRQHRSPDPLIDFRIFKSPAFSSAVVASLTASACLMGVNLVLSQRLQLVLSMSAVQTGLYFLPLSLGAILGSPLSG